MARERRGATRYELELPVVIGDMRGFTRNIGIGGALIVCPRRFAPNDPIDLVVEITFSDPHMPTRLRCVGVVRRVHKLRRGHALAITFTDVHVLTARTGELVNPVRATL
jgi:hypothetical protein